MANGTDDPSRRSASGPWPVVQSVDQIFDYGAWWCANADGHPAPDDLYPEPSLHIPPFECRTYSSAVDGARADLAGARRDFEIYAARPYRFGEPRLADRPAQPRVVFDSANDDGDDVVRISVALGDALRIAAHLTRLVSLLDTAPAGRRS